MKIIVADDKKLERHNLIEKWLKNSLQILNNRLTKKIYTDLNQEIKQWKDDNWLAINNSLQYSLKDRQNNSGINSSVMDLIKAKQSPCFEGCFIILPISRTKTYKKNLDRLLVIMRRTKKLSCLAIVLDNCENPALIADYIIKKLSLTKIPYYLFQNSQPIGYLKTIKTLIQKIDVSEFQYIGFIDDDAYPTTINHYNLLISALENDDSLFAVSGLAVDNNSSQSIHDFFNLANDYLFFRKAYKKGYDLSKPHIHGGGGACLLRKKDFIESLKIAIKYNTLLGPTISVYGRFKSYKCSAINKLLVLHPTKASFFEWILTIRRYYSSWNVLKNKFPISEIFWKDYLLKEQRIFLELRKGAEFKKYCLLKEFRSQFEKFDKNMQKGILI